MRGHWHGWRESIPSYWGRCGIAVRKRKSTDGDPSAGRTGACSNGLGERGTRVGEVLWAAATQVWHAAGQPGAGRGIARRVARGSGTAAQRNRITERAHPGIRGADGENRQGKTYPHVELLKQVKGVGTQIALTYVLTLDDSASVPEESRGRLFSRIAPWAQGLR